MANIVEILNAKVEMGDDHSKNYFKTAAIDGGRTDNKSDFIMGNDNVVYLLKKKLEVKGIKDEKKIKSVRVIVQVEV